jgi:hypothetical protein
LLADCVHEWNYPRDCGVCAACGELVLRGARELVADLHSGLAGFAGELLENGAAPRESWIECSPCRESESRMLCR